MAWSLVRSALRPPSSKLWLLTGWWWWCSRPARGPPSRGSTSGTGSGRGWGPGDNTGPGWARGETECYLMINIDAVLWLSFQTKVDTRIGFDKPVTFYTCNQSVLLYTCTKDAYWQGRLYFCGNFIFVLCLCYCYNQFDWYTYVQTNELGTLRLKVQF